MEEKKQHKKRVCVRLTEDEYDAIMRRILSLEQKEGACQTFSEGVRQLLRNAVTTESKEQIQRPLIDKELAREIRSEVNKIGTNVNQLAKNINAVLKQGEKASRATENKLINSLELVSQHLEDILNRVKELS